MKLKTMCCLKLIAGILLLMKMTAMPAEKLVLPDPIPAHPRLLASDADFERVRKQIQSDPVSARIFASLENRAGQIPPIPLQTG